MRPVAIAAVLSACSIALAGATYAEQISVYAGPGHVGPYPLYEPKSLDLSASGDLYVLGGDSYNVIRIRPNGLASQMATAADGLFVPTTLAVAPNGDVYIANHVVFRAAAAGGVSIVDFGGMLTHAYDVAIDSSNNLYVASTSLAYFSGAVYKRTPGGALSVVVDPSGTGAPVLLYAVDVVTAGSGDIFVAGRDSNNVFKIAAAGGAITEIIDGTGDGAGNVLLNPRGLAVDSSGNVYVVGLVSRNAFKITPGGAITEIIDETGDGLGSALDDAFAIAAGPTGNVYVAGADKAFRITPGGVVSEIIDSVGNGMGGAFVYPISPGAMQVDSGDNVYISGFSSNNVVRITPGGAISTVIDSTGDGLGNSLVGPGGIALDSSGSVFVGGRYSNNVFEITSGGVVTQIMDDTGAGGTDTLAFPFSMALDGSGNLVVYDTGTPRRVFEVTLGGSISVLFDSDVAGFPANEFGGGLAVDLTSGGAPLLVGSGTNNVLEVAPGGSATEIIEQSGEGSGEPLSAPGGLALDASDNLYVTGYLSNNAFRVTPGGTVTQLIDGDGDGAGNTLQNPADIAIDASGDVYVVGEGSNNLFRIALGGAITEILDATGDGLGHPLSGPYKVAVDGPGNAYVVAWESENVFHVAPDGSIRQILDATGDGQGNTLACPSGVATDGTSVFVTGECSNNIFRIGPAIVPALAPLSLGGVVLGILAIGWWTGTARRSRSGR